MNFQLLYIILDFLILIITDEAINNEEDCGSWQKQYSNLHDSIMKRSKPTRLLISVSVQEGLADNLTGMVTQFLFAFLTNRAFLRLSCRDTTRIEDIFRPAQFSWDKNKIPEKLFSALMPNPHYPKTTSLTCLKQKGKIIKWNGVTICPLQLINSNKTHSIYYYNNLSSIPNSKDHSSDVIAIAGNRGRSIALFKNPFYAEYLTSIGLRPETIFSCIYRYLFRYKSDVICISDACKRAKNAIIDSKRNGSVIIGMHVRISDEIFRHDMNVTLVNASGHFSCAEQYMSEISQKNESVIFLVSNSLNLRLQAKKWYGDKLITDTVTRSSHTGHITYNIFYIS